MKYKDYYAILGVERAASVATIKKAYRTLARKYHPDVSKDPDGEAKFKDLAEAYQTLKDADKRAAYDQLGTHAAGQDFAPSRDWGETFHREFGGGQQSFDGIDLSDLFANLGRQRAAQPVTGEDFEVTTTIQLEDAFTGREVTLNLYMPVFDTAGRVRREAKQFMVVVPKGATQGQRLRLRGKGGPGANGGSNGDLYLTIKIAAHALYRSDGHDLYIDLPLTPWEAALGCVVEVPTLGGMVNLKIAPGTIAGQQLRLAKRGLPMSSNHGESHSGDLFAIVQLVMPPVLSSAESALLKQLADISAFDPRKHFDQENVCA